MFILLIYKINFGFCVVNSGRKITVTVASSDSVCSPVPTTVCVIFVIVFTNLYCSTDITYLFILSSCLFITSSTFDRRFFYFFVSRITQKRNVRIFVKFLEQVHYGLEKCI